MKYLLMTFLLVFIGCGRFNPKYRTGDCFIIEPITSPEFIREPLEYNRVLKVGKRNYLYEFGNFKLQSESEILDIDLFSEKIDCSVFDNT